MDEDVVQAFQMAQHRNASLVADPRHQALAAPGNDQVDGALEAGQHEAHGVPVGCAHHLDAGLRKAGLGQARGDRGVDRQV